MGNWFQATLQPFWQLAAGPMQAGPDLEFEVREVAKRSKRSVGVHLVLSSTVMVIAIFQHHRSVWILALCSLILFLNIMRIFVGTNWIDQRRLTAVQWRRLFSALVTMIAVAWGALSSASILLYGVQDELSFTLLLLSAGLANGAVPSLSPWRRLSVIFVALVLGMPAITTMFSGGLSHLAISIGMATFAVFLWLQSDTFSELHVSMRDRENKYQAFTKHGMEGAIIHQDGYIIEVNDAFLGIFDLERAETIGKPVFDFIRKDYHHEARQKVREAYTPIWEIVGINGLGLEIPIETWGSMMTYRDRPARVTFLRDIQSRKMIENALKRGETELQELMTSAFDSLADIVLVMTVDGTIESANRKWREYSNMSLQETNQESFAQLIAVEDRDGFEKFMRTDQMEQRQYSARLLRHSDQTYRRHLGRSSALRDRNGAIVKWFFSWTDVDDQLASLQRNHELEVSAKSALEASAVKSEFLANMSHEIRTPLNAIIGLSELLLEIPATPLQTKYQKTLKESAESLLTIVNDVLDLSKIESGQVVTEDVEFELAQVIEFQLELLNSRAHEKSLSLCSFVDPAIPKQIIGDSARLAQIILNLATNAVKFTRYGGVAIRASLLYQDVEQTWVRFEIEDTGIGMTKAEQTKLFQPFSQVDASTSRKYGGTGLGLSICLGFVGLMGGRISVHSEKDRGSVFTFDLPFKLDPAHQIALPNSEEQKIASGALALILDDDSMTFGVKNAYLQAWGWRTEHSSARKLKASSTEALKDVRLIVLERSADRELVPVDLAWLAELNLAVGCQVIVSGPESERQAVMGYLPTSPVRFIASPIKQNEFFAAIYESSPAAASPELVASAPSLGLAPEVAAGMPVPDTADDEAAMPSLGGKRILVAEDNSTNQMLIKALLRKLGYHPHVVANGLEAIDAIRREKFDLILMDCQMPEMDGFEATMRIRASEIEEAIAKKIKIIALTANVRVEDRERCMSVGMDDFLSKPIRKSALVEKLEHWLAA